VGDIPHPPLQFDDLLNQAASLRILLARGLSQGCCGRNCIWYKKKKKKKKGEENGEKERERAKRIPAM